MSDWTFQVIDNHPRMARNYCELCGAEVDRTGEVVQSQERDDKHGDMSMAISAMRWMARWHIHKPEQLRAIALKLEHPEYSLRELEKYCSIKRSQLSLTLREAVEIRPLLAVILGLEAPKARGQRKRRNNERKQHDDKDNQ